MRGFLRVKHQGKWSNDLNIWAKTIRLLEESGGVNLRDLEFDNGFLNMISKAWATGENKLDLIKIKKLLCNNRRYQESEKTTYKEGENICQSHLIRV